MCFLITALFLWGLWRTACGTVSTAVGAGEEPVLAAGGVVGEADAAVVEEASERRPALQHIASMIGSGTGV